MVYGNFLALFDRYVNMCLSSTRHYQEEAKKIRFSAAITSLINFNYKKLSDACKEWKNNSRMMKKEKKVNVRL